MPFAVAAEAVAALSVGEMIAGAGLAANIGGQIAGAVGGSSGQAAQQQYDASGRAIAQQQQAQDQALALQREQLDFSRGVYDQTRADLDPYRKVGGNALQALINSFGLTEGGGYNPAAFTTEWNNIPGWAHGGAPDIQTYGQNFQKSPGYQFQFDEGQRALENMASRTGVGGNALRGLAQFGTGLANQDFYNQYNASTNEYWKLAGLDQSNRTGVFNKLSQLAGVGQNAAVQQGAAGVNAGNQGITLAGQGSNVLNSSAGNIGSAMIGQGNANAAGIIGNANAWTNATSNIGNNALGLYRLYQGAGGGDVGGGMTTNPGYYGGGAPGGYSGGSYDGGYPGGNPYSPGIGDVQIPGAQEPFTFNLQ